MKKSKITTIEELLKGSEKAELLEWLSEYIKDADKCLIVCAYRNEEKGGLDLESRQMGFQYLYEIEGFIEWVKTCWFNEYEDD